MKLEPAVFRKDLDGTVAPFPNLPAHAHYCTCYQYIGQHSSADYGLVISHTVLATFSEYEDHKKELESCGYYLRVYHRRPPRR